MHVLTYVKNKMHAHIIKTHLLTMIYIILIPETHIKF